MDSNILNEISKELQLHIAFLSLVNCLSDNTHLDDVQTLIDFFAQRLMNLDDYIQEMKEV